MCRLHDDLCSRVIVAYETKRHCLGLLAPSGFVLRWQAQQELSEAMTEVDSIQVP